MFEVAELDQTVSKEEFARLAPDLRLQLLEVQQQLKSADFPLIVLISGVDGAGKGETINLLNEWWDPRYVRSDAFGSPTDEERERPEFWRFWRALPARGHIASYVGSWYSSPLSLRVNDKISDVELDEKLKRINTFEKELVDGGALIIKIWLHLSKDKQKARIKKLESDPKTRWRVSKQDHKHLKLYDKFRGIAEYVLRVTGTGEAPWTIIEGADKCYRSLTVGQYILARLGERLEQQTTATISRDMSSPLVGVKKTRTVLDTLDLSRALEQKDYKSQLAKYQGKLHLNARTALAKGISSVIVLEGWDAAGKGGVIRRVIPALDARFYHVIPIAAPTEEERAHHYLWRFWRHVSRRGHFTIYDRSWYGRVLVERVENLARKDEWMCAYAEINDFEAQLIEHGIVLTKFWLHIDKDEQFRRFKVREETPFKRYKITEEDYRNREKWEDYEQAVNDMIERTSTECSPWVLVESNDKRFARLKIIKTISKRLQQVL